MRRANLEGQGKTGQAGKGGDVPMSTKFPLVPNSFAKISAYISTSWAMIEAPSAPMPPASKAAVSVSKRCEMPHLVASSAPRTDPSPPSAATRVLCDGRIGILTPKTQARVRVYRQADATLRPPASPQSKRSLTESCGPLL